MSAPAAAFAFDDREINKRRVASRTAFQWIKGVVAFLIVLISWTCGLISPLTLVGCLLRGGPFASLSASDLRCCRPLRDRCCARCWHRVSFRVLAEAAQSLGEVRFVRSRCVFVVRLCFYCSFSLYFLFSADSFARTRACTSTSARSHRRSRWTTRCFLARSPPFSLTIHTGVLYWLFCCSVLFVCFCFLVHCLPCFFQIDSQHFVGVVLHSIFCLGFICNAGFRDELQPPKHLQHRPIPGLVADALYHAVCARVCVRVALCLLF